jgi:hypothetical protein
MKKLQQIEQFSKGFSDLCSRLDASWIVRSRKLKTLDVIQLLLLQVESSRRSSLLAMAQLMYMLGSYASRVSASAISQARGRMHWRCVRELFQYTVKFHQSHAPKALWKGRRVFAIDGTRLSLPSSFKQKRYLRPGKIAHYPQAMMTVLYQLKAGIPHDAQFCRHFDERRAALHHLKYLQAGDVVVVDRGFFLQNFCKVA